MTDAQSPVSNILFRKLTEIAEYISAKSGNKTSTYTEILGILSEVSLLGANNLAYKLGYINKEALVEKINSL